MSDAKDTERKEESKSMDDEFELYIFIKEKAKEIGFDPVQEKIIIQNFQKHRIRSTDFSFDRFTTRKEFVVDYCQEQCQISTEIIVKGKLINLYNALNSEYRITAPCTNIDNQQIYMYGQLVFISKKYTQEIITNQFLHSTESQTFDTSERLYQYLRWTVRLNKTNRYINCYKSHNNIQLLVVNAELHDKNGNALYMFCIKNDKISQNAQKWQLAKLITATEVIELVGGQTMNDVTDILPQGPRKNGAQFTQFKHASDTKSDILDNWNDSNYSQLKMIQTKDDKKGKRDGKKHVLKISLSQFVARISAAAKSLNKEHRLFPIVSIISGKKYKTRNGDYNIDQVLPVKIGDNWIAVCYRDGLPFQVLFDPYDITNKAILYSPTFNANTLSFFTNKIYKIEITSKQRDKSITMKEWNDNTDPDDGFQHPPYYKPSDGLQSNKVDRNKTKKQEVYYYPNDASKSNIHQSMNAEGDIQNNANTPTNYNYSVTITSQTQEAQNINTSNSDQHLSFQTNTVNPGQTGNNRTANTSNTANTASVGNNRLTLTARNAQNLSTMSYQTGTINLEHTYKQNELVLQPPAVTTSGQTDNNTATNTTNTASVGNNQLINKTVQNVQNQATMNPIPNTCNNQNMHNQTLSTMSFQTGMMHLELPGQHSYKQNQLVLQPPAVITPTQSLNMSCTKLQILISQLKALEHMNQQNPTPQLLLQYEFVYQQYQLELTNAYLLQQSLQTLGTNTTPNNHPSTVASTRQLVNNIQM